MKKRSRRKRGFTLLEIGAVLGIIMLLISFFVPKVSGYLNDSKNIGIMAQAKTVIFAWETINIKENKNLGKATNKNTLLNMASDRRYEDYFDLDKTKNLDGEVTIEQCMKIVDGEPFNIDANGKFNGFIEKERNLND